MDGTSTFPGEHRIKEAHQFFRLEVMSWLTGTEAGDAAVVGDQAARVHALSDVLQARLFVVAINLSGHDDDQVIFETLNDRGDTPAESGPYQELGVPDRRRTRRGHRTLAGQILGRLRRRVVAFRDQPRSLHAIADRYLPAILAHDANASRGPDGRGVPRIHRVRQGLDGLDPRRGKAVERAPA
jgi:hypothetical protein